MRRMAMGTLACILLLAGGAGSATAQCVDPPESVVSWWPGDGAPEDIVGVNQGTLVGGMGFGPGLVAQAFFMDGINDFVDCGNDVSARPDFPFTVDFWVNMSSPSTLYGIASTDVGGNGLYSGFRVYVSPQGAVVSGIGSNLGCCSALYRRNHISADGLVTLGNWHHVAVVFENALNHIIYVDGAAVATTADGLALTMGYGPGNRLDIGRVFDPSTGQTVIGHGYIDELELHGDVVSADKIREIYEAGEDGKCKDSPLPAETDSWGTLKSRFGRVD